MPYNIPTVTTTDISFGPARVFIGASGATPTVDVGALADDAVTVEWSAEIKDIQQGNPQTIEHAFAKAQSLKISFALLEWDFTTFAYGMGAGVTSSSASLETLTWGGDPIVTTVALQVQHFMAGAADTLDIRCWKARPEGKLSMSFTQEEHKFSHSYMAMRSSTNWGGAPLGATAQLVQVTRQLT